MIDHSNGGEVSARLYLKRQGVRRDAMRLVTETPIKVSMVSDADIKMTMQATAEYDGEIDYFRDTLEPVLVFNGVEHPVGNYVIGGSVKESDGMRTWYQLTGFDLTQKARRHCAEERLYFPTGMKYTDAMEQLLTLAGITNYLVEPSDFVMATDREDWERGENHLTIINALLREMNYNTLYAGLDGIVRATAYRTPTAQNVTVCYGVDGAKILVPGARIEVDAFSHYNVFHYTCENPDLVNFFTAYSENSSAGNRFSTLNQGRVPVFRKMDNAPSQHALQEICDRERLESMIANNTIEFETGLNPAHSAFDVVAINKKEFNGIIKETEWSMELHRGGVMRHKGKQAELEI